MKEEELFHQALEQPADRRASFLDAECSGDAEMREHVEVLLRAHANPGSFLESPAHGVSVPPTIDQPPAEQVGTMIGSYKLVEEIGEGGMGSVFMALQKEPVRRKVALKVIKPGMDSKQVVSRFEGERQALAMMDHPSIARVFDGGSTESGRPYFVMELVNGMPVNEYCDRYRFTTEQRLELFGQVCQAVQHAHQKGVIHRDLKPSNILVTHVDGRAVPKVIDFGIAKAISGQLTEDTMVSHFAQMIGTPLYMSPEQADLSSPDIDTRSDVYSLGVLLYELLTGTTPFDRERMNEVSYDEFRRIIQEEEPPRPSTRLSTLDAALDTVAEKHHTDPRTLSRQLSGELDWIVMKALEKDRTRRYESAAELAKDVQRYLDDEAVEACPPSRAYRLRKFARRNKATMVTMASVMLALILGAGIATGQAVRATKAEQLAKKQEQLAIKQMQVAKEGAERERRLAEEAKAQRELAGAMLLLALQDFNPVGAAFGPDGNFYVSSNGTSRVLRFHGSTGAFLSEFITAGSGGLDHPEGLVFGPDANGDGTDDIYVANGEGDSVLLYDGATGAFLDTFVSVGSGGLRKPTGLTFGPDGNLYVASLATNSILRYDATDGRFLDEFVPTRSGGLEQPQMAAFGPDGNLYVASFGTNSVLRYDGTSGHFVDEFVPPGSGGLSLPEALAFGPEGTLYVIGGRPSGVLRYDGETGQFLDDFIPSGAGGLRGGQTLTFGSDGNLYVTSFGTDSVLRYDGETGEFIDTFVTYDRKRLIGPVNRSPTVRRGLVRIHLQMAVAQRRMGNDKEAERTVGQAIELAADPPDFFVVGDHYFHQREYDKALPHLDQAIGLDSAYSEAYDRRGYVYLERGDLDKAIADFDKAIQFGAAYPSSYSYRGGIHAEKGNFKKAVADYSKAVERVPKSASYRYRHALAQLGAEDIEGYRASCRQMLDQVAHIEVAEAAHWLAWSCACAPDAIGDFSEAVSAAQRAVKSDIQSILYLNTLGAVRYRAGWHKRAIERLSKAAILMEEPDATSKSSPAYTWYFLAMAHHAAGDSEKANQWRKKADEWADRVLQEDQEDGGAPVPWNRRLTLNLLRSEAEAVLNVAHTDEQPESSEAQEETLFGGLLGQPFVDEAGRQRQLDTRLPRSVGPVAMDPESRLVAIGCENQVRVYEVPSLRLVRVFCGHATRVLCLAWSPADNWLASGGSDGVIRLWNPHDGSAGAVLHAHFWRVIDLAWNHDGSLLASSSGWPDGTVAIWQPDGTYVRGLRAGALVEGLSWHPSGDWLAAGGGDRRFRVWKVSDGSLRPPDLDYRG